MRRFVLPFLALLAAGPAALAQPRVAGPAVPFAPEGFVRANVSPDGRFVALTQPGLSSLWVVEAASPRAPRRLVETPGVGFGAAWRPDGSGLAVRLGPPAAGMAETFRLAFVSAETGAVTPLTEARASMPALPAWTPGGDRVVLAADERVETFGVAGAASVGTSAAAIAVAAHGEGLLGVSAAGTTVVPLPRPGRVLRAVPSPSGARLAIEMLGGDLWLVDRDGANAVSLGRGEAPAWSPDGRYVAFMVTEDDGEQITASDLVVASASGRERAFLTRTPGTLEMYPAWLSTGALLYDDAATATVMRLPLTAN